MRHYKCVKAPTESSPQSGFGRGSAQIRIRLRSEERRIYEQLRSEAWQAGQPHAETLSSWVREQLRPLTHAPVNRERCPISKELYELLSQMAEKVGITPESFIEACIDATIDMADHPKRKHPALIDKCRRAGNAAKNKPL